MNCIEDGCWNETGLAIQSLFHIPPSPILLYEFYTINDVRYVYQLLSVKIQNPPIFKQYFPSNIKFHKIRLCIETLGRST